MRQLAATPPVACRSCICAVYCTSKLIQQHAASHLTYLVALLHTMVQIALFFSVVSEFESNYAVDNMQQ
jgi:hypothetical protein